jgi:alkylation response protein AidB-like acyl-CoA dehydrogenase
MSQSPHGEFSEIRESVRRLCEDFPGAYWRERDRDRTYPTEFVQTLTGAGFLSVLIPEEYGGSGLGLGAATAILEEIHRAGGNGGACHAQMYTMGTVLKHGSPEQKAAYLPKIASASCGCRRSASPNRPVAPTPHAFEHSRAVTAITM